MNKIQVEVLNPEVVADAEKMMVCAARLTQRGHKIGDMDDFKALLERPYDEGMAAEMAELPHNTTRQFGMINVAVIGASRRFLAQITRRRVGVTFMSASLQYSNYSRSADFVVPYKLIPPQNEKARNRYLVACKDSMHAYHAVTAMLENDTAGYLMPHGLRNALIISATPQAWIEMIRQRICRRNTDETRYVMLLIGAELEKLSYIFAVSSAGAGCQRGECAEDKMGCRNPIGHKPFTYKPFAQIIRDDFPLLCYDGGAE